MRDYDEELIKEEVNAMSTPEVDDAIKFCLQKLFDDNKHNFYQEVVHNLTFCELLGALILAQVKIRELECEVMDALERTE